LLQKIRGEADPSAHPHVTPVIGGSLVQVDSFGIREGVDTENKHADGEQETEEQPTLVRLCSSEPQVIKSSP
jgi:hypothetical protein